MTSYSDKMKEIIDWITDPMKRKGDLVVSYELVAGFEHAIIMDLTGGDSSVVTRTLAHVIRIFANPILSQYWAIQNILQSSHDCSTIMDWTSTRPKVPSDIISMIGKIVTFNTLLILINLLSK